MRILIDCSFVYRNPHLHTGIQRVVRSVAARAGNAHPVVCLPVVVDGAEFRLIKTLDAVPMPANAHWARFRHMAMSHLQRWIAGCWNLHERHEEAVARTPFLRVTWWWSCRLLSAPAAVAMRVVKSIRAQSFEHLRSQPLEPEPGDVLVLLDANWIGNYRPVVHRCHLLGISVVAVVYDLIPLTHPQFCVPGMIREFTRWFDWIAGAADGYIAISVTIRDEVREKVGAIRAMHHAERPAAPWFDFFHLGTELDRQVPSATPDGALADLFRAYPVYLVVGTIEPRKNHAYLLDAYELLWAAGIDVALCIIGRAGWKNNELMHRIETHPEFGKRLRLFGDAVDVDLDYAYRHARSLVFASIVEGFGLPLAEAMQRGLPAMVSDIPVFREIGQDSAAYFDLAQPQALADLVLQFEQSGKFPATRPLQDWSWVDWDGATAQLVASVIRHCRAVDIHSEGKLSGELSCGS